LRLNVYDVVPFAELHNHGLPASAFAFVSATAVLGLGGQSTRLFPVLLVHV